jgi:hypothetical protein
MELHAPSKWPFMLSLVIAAASILFAAASIEFMTQQAFVVALIAYGVLVLANVVDISPTKSE